MHMHWLACQLVYVMVRDGPIQVLANFYGKKRAYAGAMQCTGALNETQAHKVWGWYLHRIATRRFLPPTPPSS